MKEVNLRSSPYFFVTAAVKQINIFYNVFESSRIGMRTVNLNESKISISMGTDM